MQLYGHYFVEMNGDTAAKTSSASRATTPPSPWPHRRADAELGVIAAYAARQLSWLTDDTNGTAARNQSDIPLEGIRPPRDRSLWPKYQVNNTLLGSGISTWKVNGAGQVVIDKARTMRRVNNAGMLDTVFRSVQVRYIVMLGLRYIRRAELPPCQQGGRALQPEQPAGDLDAGRSSGSI